MKSGFCEVAKPSPRMKSGFCGVAEPSPRMKSDLPQVGKVTFHLESWKNIPTFALCQKITTL